MNWPRRFAARYALLARHARDGGEIAAGPALHQSCRQAVAARVNHAAPRHPGGAQVDQTMHHVRVRSRAGSSDDKQADWLTSSQCNRDTKPASSAAADFADPPIRQFVRLFIQREGATSRPDSRAARPRIRCEIMTSAIASFMNSFIFSGLRPVSFRNVSDSSPALRLHAYGARTRRSTGLIRDATGTWGHHHHAVGRTPLPIECDKEMVCAAPSFRPRSAIIPGSCRRASGVQRAERLIHKQQRRIEQQGTAERGALLHATREFVWPLVREILQAGEPQQFERAFAILPRIEAGQLRRQ